MKTSYSPSYVQRVHFTGKFTGNYNDRKRCFTSACTSISHEPTTRAVEAVFNWRNTLSGSEYVRRFFDGLPRPGFTPSCGNAQAPAFKDEEAEYKSTPKPPASAASSSSSIKVENQPSAECSAKPVMCDMLLQTSRCLVCCGTRGALPVNKERVVLLMVDGLGGRSLRSVSNYCADGVALVAPCSDDSVGQVFFGVIGTPFLVPAKADFDEKFVVRLCVDCVLRIAPGVAPDTFILAPPRDERLVHPPTLTEDAVDRAAGPAQV